MRITEVCTEENFIWKNDYSSSYLYRRDASSIHMVMKYQIPFSPDDEKIFMERFDIPVSERKEFYQNLLKCIQQQIKASAILAQQNVPSCIKFYGAEQERDENGITSIYLETDYLRPLCQTTLSELTDELEAANIASRLAIILRDLQKEPHKVTLRALDPNEIFINDENKLVLGGLFYAASPFLPEPPKFLPTVTPNIHKDVLTGGTGHAGTDMYSLACMIWNLYAGIPLDAKLPEHIDVFPQYASEDLAMTLLLGRHGREEDVAAFRRQLGKCRACYSKKDTAPVKIPIRRQRRKEYIISIV